MNTDPLLTDCVGTALEWKTVSQSEEDIWTSLSVPPREVEETGAWSWSRETQINKLVWEFVKVCRFWCRTWNSFSSCVCLLSVEMQIIGGRSGTVWSTALQGHEWFNGKRGELVLQLWRCTHYNAERWLISMTKPNVGSIFWIRQVSFC